LSTLSRTSPGPFVNQISSPSLEVSPHAGRGWTLKASHAFAAGAPVSRVRLYRVIERNDPAFDLTYDHPDREPVPSLAGVRSYLTDPLWIPVRDFQLEVEDLPPLPDATRAAATTSDTAYTLELPIPVAGGGGLLV
jgi:hypothetical protein